MVDEHAPYMHVVRETALLLTVPLPAGRPTQTAPEEATVQDLFAEALAKGQRPLVSGLVM